MRLIISLAILIIIFIFRVIQIGGLSSSQTQSDLDRGANFRKFLSHQVGLFLPDQPAALLDGILIGDQTSLGKDLTAALKRTSTIHMVVVSGQNLSLLASFSLILAPLIGRKFTLLLTSLLITSYAFLTGFQVPVIRALIMVELGFVAQLLGRDQQSQWTLLLTASLMLIYNPNWLLSISFQLSFMATVAVVVVAPILIKRFSFVPELLKEELAVSIAAQIMTWPIIASNFHQASIFGFLVNLLVLWTIPVIMISGGLVLVLSFWLMPLASLLAVVPNTLLTYFIATVQLGDKVPWISLKVIDFPVIFWVGYYLVVAGVLAAWRL